jgi:SagB-type dehydrogenase family enzyme
LFLVAAKPEPRAPVHRYRRSPALVFYWTSDRLTAFDAICSRRVHLPGEMLACLDLLSSWQSAAALRRRAPDLGSIASIEGLMRVMHAMGLVRRDDDAAEWPWASWSPEASFFHFGTRGGVYPDDKRAHDRRLRRKARTDPPPEPTKAIRGRRIALVPAEDLGELSSALLDRRTWRNFDPTPVRLEDLSTLLRLTWGVQKWRHVKGQGPIVLKTSPSGGARHSIEAYVLARNVKGLKSGAYHYDAARHQLVDLKRRVSARLIVRLLAKQHYYGPASAVVVMSAVFARAMWRYPSNRAYRSLLIEAGHLAQTFCLVATARRLAPFCTMAFDDQQVEDLLRIGGPSESAIYVVGVAQRSSAHRDHPGRLPPEKSVE